MSGLGQGVPMAKPLIRPFRVWYDGLDASDQQMDIETLGESLQGVGRILRVSTHFAFRHEYNKRRDKSYVRILVEPPKPGTWWCDAIAVAAPQYSLLAYVAEHVIWETAINVAKATLFHRSGRREANDRIMDLLEKSLQAQSKAVDAIVEVAENKDAAIMTLAETLRERVERDAGTTDQLFDVVKRLVDSQQVSAKKAVKPIGSTCSRMCLGDPDEESFIDEAMASAIQSEEDVEVMDEKNYTVRFDGITLHTRACKVEVVGQEGRYVSGKITDPELSMPNNIYTNAFNTRSPLVVRAKETRRGGELVQLYISDARKSA